MIKKSREERRKAVDNVVARIRKENHVDDHNVIKEHPYVMATIVILSLSAYLLDEDPMVCTLRALASMAGLYGLAYRWGLLYEE